MTQPDVELWRIVESKARLMELLSEEVSQTETWCCACMLGLSAWCDRLHSSVSRQLVALALRALADAFRHHVQHRISPARRRAVPDGRARPRPRRGPSGAVETCAALPLPASVARHTTQPAEVLPHGRPAVSHGRWRATVRQGRPARLPSISQIFPETSV